MENDGYKPQYDRTAYLMALDDAADYEIARFFRISDEMCLRWRVDHQSFDDSIERGRALSEYMSISEGQYRNVAARGKGAGVPSWAVGSDLAWDFTASYQKYFGAVDPADTHAASIYAPNAAGVYTPFGANVLTRTDLGLQTVPTRTNLALWSQQFDNAAWTKAAATVSADTDAAPDGTTTADRLVEGGTTAAHQLTSGAVVVSGSTYTLSVFAKAGSAGRYLGIRLASGVYFSGEYAIADLSAGTVQTSGGGTITPLGNGWYRVTIVAVAKATGSPAASTNIAITNSASAINSYAGDGASFIPIWQAQFELGAFASPPILTTSAAATVNGNQQVITPAQSYSLGAATEITVNVLGLNDGDWLWQDNDGSANNRAGICQNAGQFQFIVDSGGVNQAALDLGAVSTGLKSFAAVYGANYAMAQLVGGTPPTPDTVVTMPVSMTKFNLGGNGFNATNNGYSYLKKAAKKFQAADAGSFTASLARATAQSVAP